MGSISAIGKYSSNQLEVSQIAKAIAHPARIAILELLNKKDYTCNDLVNVLPLSQSTVSQHLKELKKVKLINGVEIPPKTIYTLNHSVYSSSMTKLNNFLNTRLS
jgi:ArsR family transcriptional regulator, arsenate/arsenite/antimonite-responsive transcriptional repressor